MFSALPGDGRDVTSGRDMGADVKTMTIIHLMRTVIIVIGASVLGLYVGVEDLRMQTPSLDHAEYIRCIRTDLLAEIVCLPENPQRALAGPHVSGRGPARV